MLFRFFPLLIFYFILMGTSRGEENKPCDQKPCSECAQLYPDMEAPEFTYKNGKLEGLQTINYKNGKLWQALMYKDNKLDGVSKIYNKDGSLRLVLVFKNNILLDQDGHPKNGLLRSFYKNGKLAGEEHYKDGLRVGESKGYYENGNLTLFQNFLSQEDILFKTFNENGKPIYDGEIIKGRFQGKEFDDQGRPEWEFIYDQSGTSGAAKHFDHNGKVDAESVIKDGKYSGEEKQFYETGKLKSQGTVVGGSWQGEYKEFYEDGHLKRQWFYKNGVPTGVSKTYDEDGHLLQEYKTTQDPTRWEEIDYYSNGNVQREGIEISNGKNNAQWDGPYKEYYKNGKLSEESNYQNGKLWGTSKHFYEDGSLDEETIHLPGHQYESKEYYKNGGLYQCLMVKNHFMSEQKNYYKNGQLLSEEKFGPHDVSISKKVYDENGQLMKNGVLKTFYQDGKIQGEVEYKNGKEDGFFKGYYQDGSLESEGINKNGQLSGRFQDFYSNGKRKYEEYYKDGQIVGTSKYYDKDGNLHALVTRQRNKDKIKTYFKNGQVQIECELPQKRDIVTIHPTDFKNLASLSTDELEELFATEDFYTECKDVLHQEYDPSGKNIHLVNSHG